VAADSIDQERRSPRAWGPRSTTPSAVRSQVARSWSRCTILVRMAF